jgi:hypothetical protein
MSVAVRCPNCGQFSRVAESALDREVACPSCRERFVAEPVELEVPIVYPSRGRSDDIEPGGDSEAAAEHKGPANVLFGLALLPFVIPLLWILGPTLTGKEAIFTFTLPMAIAIASTGLCLGMVLAEDWSFGTRVKGILAIVLLMHFFAGMLYFLKTEWVESIRKMIGRANEDRWVRYVSPDKKFAARVPSQMREDDGSPLADWTLKTFRTDAPQDPALFTIAHGRQPADLNEQPDEKFFEAAKAKAMEAAGGTLLSDPREVRLPGRPGREFVFQMADKNTRRIVRVFRIERFAFVATVEGAFLTPDAGDVKTFFDHLEWNPGK